MVSMPSAGLIHFYLYDGELKLSIFGTVSMPSAGLIHFYSTLCEPA